jgi:predicted transcriptional regulator of viral defense system
MICSLEEVMMGLASRQHGVVSRTQLLSAGVPPDVVDRLLKAKRLRLIHRGVYLVGPLQPAHAKEMAAVLACAGAGVVSHWSAFALWQVLQRSGGNGPVEVSTTTGDHARRPGIRVHRVRTLRPDEVTKLDGIPLTTVARTLYDVASEAGQRELERALAEALSRRLTNRAEILSLMAHHLPRPGCGRLRALLEDEAQAALTRSEAEERFLALVRKAQLTKPATNVDVAGHEVDFFWREERFIVEVDGFAFHSSAGKFERDRRRDAALAAAGMRVTRVTWRQLTSEPEALLVRLAQALVR